MSAPAWAETRHRIASVWGRVAWQRPVGQVAGVPGSRATVELVRVDDEDGPGAELILLGGYRLDAGQARDLARLLVEAAWLLDGQAVSL